VSNEIAQLLEIQCIDQRLVEASEHIKRLNRDRARLEEKVVEADQAFAAQQQDLKQLEHDSLMLNLHVDELDNNIRDYQHRLDTGIISFKEMEDLRAKIISERKRINQMEDDALQMMDRIASDKAAIDVAKTALSERHKELAAAIAEADAEIGRENDEIAALQEQRAALAGEMSEFLLSQYESLHRKFADPIVTINNMTCAGCKLKLSGSTIERARGSLSIVTCEHCSRILYTD
jgi:uncharacterized protein